MTDRSYSSYGNWPPGPDRQSPQQDLNTSAGVQAEGTRKKELPLSIIPVSPLVSAFSDFISALRPVHAASVSVAFGPLNTAVRDLQAAITHAERANHLSRTELTEMLLTVLVAARTSR